MRFDRMGVRVMREQLTQSDIRKIQEEIDYRKLVVRKEAIEAVKEARAQGDLSENFEYYAAKKDKNRNESRIRYLENMIKNARVVSDKSGWSCILRTMTRRMCTALSQASGEIPWKTRSVSSHLSERPSEAIRSATGSMWR